MASGGASTRSIFERIADTAPVISSMVSPRTRIAIKRPPICEGVASPDIMRSNAMAACSRLNEAPLAACPISALRSMPVPSMRRARARRRLRRFGAPLRRLGAHTPVGIPLGREREKILQHEMPVLGGDAFGMELHAVNGQRPMGEAHHQAVGSFRRHLEVARHRVAVDHERMVARRPERAVDAAKDALAAMADLGQLAMHRQGRAHDVTPESLADRLMAETDAEDRNGAGGLFYQVEAEA